MSLHHRIPAWAASSALAVLLFAPQALAGDVAYDVCGGDPDGAPETLEAAYAGWDTSALDAGQCATACQAVRKACQDLARNIALCHADQNKREAKVDGGLCADKDCKKTVKEDKKTDDKMAKDLAKDAKVNACKGLEADCADNCENLDTFYPLPG